MFSTSLYNSRISGNIYIFKILPSRHKEANYWKDKNKFVCFLSEFISTANLDRRPEWFRQVCFGDS